MRVGNSVEKGKELVERWKEMGGGQGGMLWNIVMTFLKNPVYLVGMFFLVKKLIKRAQSGKQQAGDQEF